MWWVTKFFDHNPKRKLLTMLSLLKFLANISSAIGNLAFFLLKECFLLSWSTGKAVNGLSVSMKYTLEYNNMMFSN